MMKPLIAEIVSIFLCLLIGACSMENEQGMMNVSGTVESAGREENGPVCEKVTDVVKRKSSGLSTEKPSGDKLAIQGKVTRIYGVKKEQLESGEQKSSGKKIEKHSGSQKIDGTSEQMAKPPVDIPRLP